MSALMGEASTGYSKAPGFLGTKAPDRLASRYLRSLGLEGLSDEQLLSL
jgi:hypothetical protein